MADVRKYLDTAPIGEAIRMIDSGVISYKEVLDYCATPLPKKKSSVAAGR